MSDSMYQGKVVVKVLTDLSRKPCATVTRLFKFLPNQMSRQSSIKGAW